LHAAEQLRPDVAEARQNWHERQGALSARRLIFIDETGATTNMVRRYGRSRRGERVKGYAPNGHWKMTTFVAGLSAEGIIAPLVVNQPMNRAIFTEFVRQFLVPKLAPGDIVIMDNLSSHKGVEVAALIEACGAELLFLPPYSPDLNPIENAFAKLKELLRKAAERNREDLWNRIGVLLDEFSPEECENYIRHAGYASS
jgi:transposase